MVSLVTNAELERLTAPPVYRQTAPYRIPGAGLTVSAVMQPVRRHRCGRCANPHTYGREDCPRKWVRDG